MQSSVEIGDFLSSIQHLPPGPGVSLDEPLKAAIEFEAELRKLFASDRQHPKIVDPHVGLIDVFQAPDGIRSTRARVVGSEEMNDLSSKYVLPLSEAKRRKEGVPCMVRDLEEFRKNWAIFSEGSLSQLADWNNVVVAGGSVLACLAPLDEAAKKSKRTIRKFYHNNAYPTSDVDVFLWGLTPEQAEAKIKTIYEAVRDSVPWDVTCVRTKHTISIHSQYPYRSVQIVLRLYQSPAEILAGFDIDAPCCAYDGERVWANPRSVVSMMRQCNTVDMTRRSPSYEVRLAKYANRGYEIFVPDLRRGEVDPTIFERSLAKVEGLARLLVLEQLSDSDKRYNFLESRRNLRGRPNPIHQRNRFKKTLKGDLKAENELPGLEQNDYDVESLHIPYGPGWDARRIDKHIYQTDLGMNSTFNPKNKGRRLHRHPAFFGTIEECLEDCCETCPPPIDDDEKKLQAEEDEKYIRGRIQFIEENPGRQSISGSFNPIDVGEWSEQVYIKPTQQLFSAIAAHDRETIKLLVKDLDVNQRDHVGRTCLHVAILCKAADIACDLIDAGARITARLVDGRTPLHLASQYDLTSVIRKLFEKNAQNVEEENLKNPKVADDDDSGGKGPKKSSQERPSSEDDWSTHDSDDVEMVDANEIRGQKDDDADDDDDDDDKDNEDGDEGKGDDEDEDNDSDDSHQVPERSPTPEGQSGDLPEDESTLPDIIDVNLLDWDFGFPALAYAVLYGSAATLDILLVNGADVTIAAKPPSHSMRSAPLHPLSLTMLRDDEDEGCAIAERLIAAGATSSTANETMWTIFHSAVSAGRSKLVATLLRCDKNAAGLINFPSIRYNNVVFPVISAINKHRYAVLAILLCHGVKLELDEVDITRAQDACDPSHRIQSYASVKSNTDLAYQAVETAIKNGDDVLQLLLAMGAPVNRGLKSSLGPWVSDDERATLIDWVELGLKSLKKRISTSERTLSGLDTRPKALPKKHTFKQFLESYRGAAINPENKKRERRELEETIPKLKETRSFLEELQRLLTARGAKKWKAVYPDIESKLSADDEGEDDEEKPLNAKKVIYVYIDKNYNRVHVPEHLAKSYDELFAACYTGDNKKIEKLCMSPQGSKAVPLNMSVFIANESKTWGNSEGYTPLFAAVAGRHWATAKLIITIVTSQYEPENKKEKKFDASNIKLHKDDSDGDDDDDEDDDSMQSDETVEEPKFVDIATRSATVRSHITARNFLDVPCYYKSHDRYCQGPLIDKAAADNDLEAFVELANLYASLAGSDSNLTKNESNTFATVLAHDSADILDEYIRRTGQGIEIKLPSAEGDSDEHLVPTNDSNRIYLGLNVHGKKRKDLATKNDPNATRSQQLTEPMLWTAARMKSKAIIEYLAGPKPLAAYRHYASANSDERAILLRRTQDLEKSLPAWLGWTIDEVGDSPYSSAVIGQDLETIQLIAKKAPELLAEAVKKRFKYIGFNLLLLAVHVGCKPDVIEFLLLQTVDTMIQDETRGWNIYHHTCDKRNGKILEFLLQKLPRDVNEALLTQESKGRSNMPLHIAAAKGATQLVKMIIDYLPSEAVFVRNIDGQTPLHLAVKHSYPEIVELLLPKFDQKSLQMEDGVGSTVADIASLIRITDKVSSHASTTNDNPDELSPRSFEHIERYTEQRVHDLEIELASLHKILEVIIPQEKKKRRTKIVWEINTFVGLVESRLKEAKVELEKAKVTQRAKSDQDSDSEEEGRKQAITDVKRTWSLIQEAFKTASIQRQLIHVSHVQKSVDASLTAVKPEPNYYWRSTRKTDDEELGEEENPDFLARRQSSAFRFAGLRMDPDQC